MAAMIQITATLAFDEDEVSYTAIRASGPGGQNVNKVSSAIQLRFDARRSPSLPDEVATRAIRLAGSRATKDGVIIITAERFRDQPRNREDALARLVALLERAAERPKPRKATRPTAASREKRLTGKAKRGAVKAKRGRVGEE
ncbi:MAG: alternative ribosome rescue aminoacyl-tRNA hydrolase ArfB [Caulobacterales bacterium]|jgi:ribosome-associated protein